MVSNECFSLRQKLPVVTSQLPEVRWTPTFCSDLKSFFWLIVVIGQTPQMGLLSGISIVLVNRHQVFLAEPSNGSHWMVSCPSSPLSTRAAAWLQRVHICLKIKLYISPLLPFSDTQELCQLKPALGKRQHAANSLTGYLCHYVLFGLYILEIVFWGEKKNPSRLLVSLSFSSSFLSAFFPSIVITIPMMDGHIFGVQNTLSIHLQIATKSSSDNCTSMRAILCSPHRTHATSLCPIATTGA